LLLASQNTSEFSTQCPVDFKIFQSGWWTYILLLVLCEIQLLFSLILLCDYFPNFRFSDSFPHLCSDQYSAENWRRALWRSLTFSLCAALSFLYSALCEFHLSYSPWTLSHVTSTQEVFWSLPGFHFCYMTWKFSQEKHGQLKSSSLFFFSCPLLPGV
jgi:hypothetical protein